MIWKFIVLNLIIASTCLFAAEPLKVLSIYSAVFILSAFAFILFNKSENSSNSTDMLGKVMGGLALKMFGVIFIAFFLLFYLKWNKLYIFPLVISYVVNSSYIIYFTTKKK